jgi:hypothetical protein
MIKRPKDVRLAKADIGTNLSEGPLSALSPKIQLDFNAT